jgi:hypothetical protein
MSSAILYLAIVAIWACVLIPRWLKRDSARGVAASPPLSAPVAVPAEPLDEAPADDTEEAPAHLPQPLSAQESRRRMLAARRRLLLMLIGLEAAAIALALLRLAAVWVVIPPSIMLGGYLLLLREAAKADAEMTDRETEGVARDLERDRARLRTVAAQQAAPDEDVSTTTEELAAKFAAAPVAADYEDSAPGRDFAPGLAGKYTTSNAGAATDEEHYGTPRLRAVGD